MWAFFSAHVFFVFFKAIVCLPVSFDLLSSLFSCISRSIPNQSQLLSSYLPVSCTYHNPLTSLISEVLLLTSLHQSHAASCRSAPAHQMRHLKAQEETTTCATCSEDLCRFSAKVVISELLNRPQQWQALTRDNRVSSSLPFQSTSGAFMTPMLKRALKGVLCLERLSRPCGRWSSHVGKA